MTPSTTFPRRRPSVARGLVIGAAGLIVAAAGVFALNRGAGPGSGEESGAAAVIPRFVEETGSAGIRHAYDGEFEFFVGGGVAAFDCDDDGRPELYLAGGTEPAGLFRNTSPVGGALRFEAVPDPATDLERVVGAYPIDIDGDRVTDLAVLRSGENVLLRGLGDCRFERANETWGFDGGDGWTAAFSATWETANGAPTLAFGRYLELKPDGTGGEECDQSQLVRPRADGPDYAPPIPLEPGFCTLSMLFSDWGRTGRRDLRVSNDRHYNTDGQEQLWRVAAGEPPRLYTEDEGWQPVRIWGMGIASQDVTGDGLPEVYLTSQGDNKLQTLAEGPGRPRYEDIALRRGATAHRPVTGDTTRPSTAWHAEWDDVNNDAHMDLFVSKGNVEAQPEYAARDPSTLLVGQPDGMFTEAAEAAGVLSMARARGAAVVDLNLDGLLDLVVVNRREDVKLWRNVGAGTADAPAALGSWLAVRLRQPGGNADAIGAWLEVRATGVHVQRELTIGGGHAGGELGWVHVGLGTASQAEVRVTWPDGEVGAWQPVTANRFVLLERGKAPEPWTPSDPGGG
jgi:enediyne biosynthesis protein E4